jgi:hypothetical protein
MGLPANGYRDNGNRNQQPAAPSFDQPRAIVSKI